MDDKTLRVAEDAKGYFKDAIEDAQQAFWAKIAEAYPEVKTGDFGPESQFALDFALEAAVGVWLRDNLPNGDPKTGDSVVILYNGGDKTSGVVVDIAGEAGTVLVRTDDESPRWEEFDYWGVATPDSPRARNRFLYTS